MGEDEVYGDAPAEVDDPAVAMLEELASAEGQSWEYTPAGEGWQTNAAYEAPGSREPEAPYDMVAMGQRYQTETDPQDMANPWNVPGAERKYTRYLDDDEREAARIQFDDDGSAWRGGSAVDTEGAASTTKDSHAKETYGRQIFTMDADGEIYSADANKERTADARFHHSSLSAGEDVAGAGEMQIRDGEVEVVADASGHFKPRMEVTEQVLDSLEGHGVQLERVGVELTAKQDGEEMVRAGAVEVEAYRDVSDAEVLRADGTPLTHEALLRARHAAKDAVAGDVEDILGGQRAELDADAIVRRAQLEGRPLNRDDVHEELESAMRSRRTALDAEAEARADDVESRTAARTRREMQDAAAWDFAQDQRIEDRYGDDALADAPPPPPAPAGPVFDSSGLPGRQIRTDTSDDYGDGEDAGSEEEGEDRSAYNA